MGLDTILEVQGVPDNYSEHSLHASPQEITVTPSGGQRCSSITLRGIASQSSTPRKVSTMSILETDDIIVKIDER